MRIQRSGSFLCMVMIGRARGLSTAGGGLRMSGVIDSHLHVWHSVDEEGSFQVEPPEALRNGASISAYRDIMKANEIEAAVITQPINYKFDHSYIAKVIKDDDQKFRGILLADPSKSVQDLKREIEALYELGFTGLRLNPSLWKTSITDEKGKAIFEICSQLKIPVCVMAFSTGFSLELESDLSELMHQYPDCVVILDHLAFPRENPALPPNPDLKFDQDAFQRLLAFAHKFPSTTAVKVSALFRCSSQVPPFSDLKAKFFQLLQAFGPYRLLFGSDFPYVILPENGGYASSLSALRSWLVDEDPIFSSFQPLTQKEIAHYILTANAYRLFFQQEPLVSPRDNSSSNRPSEL